MFRFFLVIAFFQMAHGPLSAQVTDSTDIMLGDTANTYADTTYNDSLEWMEEYDGETISYEGSRELMNEEVDYDFKSNYGPNQKNFFQGYTYTGFFVGPSDTGTRLNYGLSLEGVGGWRYKRKLSGMFSLVTDLGFRSVEYNIAQPHQNQFLDTTFWHKTNVSHKKEKIGYYAIDLGGFLRINFDPKRGNFLGHYIDLGAYGSYNFSKKYVAVDELIDDTRVRTRVTRFPYMNPLHYELTAKFGFNILALVVKYRMTDVFKDEYRFPEFPRIVLGLEISSLD